MFLTISELREAVERLICNFFFHMCAKLRFSKILNRCSIFYLFVILSLTDTKFALTQVLPHITDTSWTDHVKNTGNTEEIEMLRYHATVE